jgi:hypothetical protein
VVEDFVSKIRWADRRFLLRRAYHLTAAASTLYVAVTLARKLIAARRA